jgi:hypothetical protein
MRKVIKNGVVFFTIFTVLFMIGLEIAFAQQSFTFMGNVINISRGNITVKGDKGEIMNFAVGRRTQYYPARLPATGERVRVSYYFQRGQNAAYQVEINPTPPSPKKK